MIDDCPRTATRMVLSSMRAAEDDVIHIHRPSVCLSDELQQVIEQSAAWMHGLDKNPSLREKLAIQRQVGALWSNYFLEHKV